MGFFGIDMFKDLKTDKPVKVDLPTASSGSEIYGGYTEQEYLGELRETRRRADIFDQMHRSDGTIFMLYNASFSQIKSADWGCRVKKNLDWSQAAQDQLDFYEEAIGKTTLVGWVSQMTKVMKYGYYVGEKYYKKIMFNGESKLQPKVKHIAARSVRQWATYQDELVGIRQETYGDSGRNVWIGADKLLHMAVFQEENDFEGISPFRACYGSWVRKRAHHKKIAVGNAYNSVPFLKINQIVENGTLGKEDLERIKRDLAKRNTGSISYMFFPYGFEAEEQTMSFDALKLYQCNDKEDIEMTRAFLTMFALLGGGGSGSRALSEDLSDFYLEGLEAVASMIDKNINALVKEAIEMNYGECLIETYHTPVGGKAGKKLAEAIKSLIPMLTKDEKLENHIRQIFKLPEREDVEEEETEETEETEVIKEKPIEEEEDKDIEKVKEVEEVKKVKEVKENKEDTDTTQGDKVDLAATGNISRQNATQQGKNAGKKIELLRERLSNLLKDELTLIVEKKASKMLTKAKKKNIFAIKIDDLDVPATQLNQKVKELIMTAFDAEFAEVSTLYKMKFASRSKFMTRVSIATRIGADVSSMVSDVDLAMIYTLMHQSEGFQSEDIASLIERVQRKTISSLITIISKNKATVMPATAINEARESAINNSEEKVVSYTYYNPSPKAKVCQFLAGKTIDATDPDAQTYIPPFHYNCATVRIANTESFKGNPKTERIAPNKEVLDSIGIGVKS